MNKIKSFIISMIIGGLAGAGIGFIITSYIPEDKIILSLLLMVFSLIIFLTLGIIIHETGHLVMGLLTGYKFISFRVGKRMILKQDEHLVFKKYDIAGTGGQCILEPPEYNDYFPYFWYNFGGGLFNLLFAALCLIIVTFTNNTLIILGAIIGLGINMLLALTNLVPLQLGVPNDGYNIYYLYKEPHCRFGLYAQMKSYSLLAKKIKFEDMDPALFKIPDHANLDNHLLQSIFFNQLNLLHEQHRFDQALELLEKVNHDCNLIQIYQNELDCEYLFYLIYQNPSDPTIKERYDKITKYLKTTAPTAIERQRLLYAYELLVNRDSASAKLHLDKFEEIAENYPFDVLVETERSVIELIQNKALTLNTQPIN